jgi:LacI family transcriptional regulator
MKRGKQPRINDVATLAEVSAMTVSRYLKDNTSVKEKTGVKIAEAIERLNYKPNVNAQRLASRRSGVFGFVIPNNFAVLNTFFTQILLGIEEVLCQHSIDLILKVFNPDKPNELANLYHQGKVDGLLILAPSSQHDPVPSLIAANVPHAIVCGHPAIENVSRVQVDNFKGVFLALDHLSALGHERIAILTGWNNVADSVERLEAFRLWHKKHKRVLNEELVICGNFEPEAGGRAAEHLFKLPKKVRPSAIFASNDLMAIGALERANAYSIAVPGEISIIGFDNIELARYQNPPLTTIAQPLQEVGREAANIALKSFNPSNNKFISDSIVKILEPQLILRGSTAHVE